MRDVGALVWVAVVLAGVISTIVSSARKQGAARVQTFRPPPSRDVPRATVAAPARAPQRSAVTAMPASQSPAPSLALDALDGGAQTWGLMHVRDLDETHKQAVRTARTLFGHRSALVRAVVAAEVLGKPHALRDEA